LHAPRRADQGEHLVGQVQEISVAQKL